MGGLFNYENKFMQALMVLGDLIILNVLFLFCSLPIFTIGAAQAGLYSGIRVLLDKEDDSSCAKAFFRGFSNGFTRITPVFCLLLVLQGASMLSLLPMATTSPLAMPVWLSIAAFIVCAVFISLTTWFHSRFSCTRMQLLRNAWLIFLSYPLRSIAISIINFLPVILFLLDGYLFMQFTPITLSIAFSTLSLASFSLMKKPFKELMAIRQEKEAPAENGEATTAEPVFHDELQDQYK